MKKTLILVLILALGVCSISCNQKEKRSVQINTDTTKNIDDAYGDPRETVTEIDAGSIESIVETEAEEENIPEWDIVEQKTLSFTLKFEGQRKSYIFTAIESGIYGFSFDINNVNLGYNINLYEQNHSIIDSIDNNSEITVELIKGERYVIEIVQDEGLPECVINISIPNPVRKIDGDTISDKFRFKGQKDKYTYSAPLTGKYGIYLDISNVQYSYVVEILDLKNEVIAEQEYQDASYNNYFVNVDLEKGETYYIIVNFEDELPKDQLEYKISIYEPNAKKNVKTNVVKGEFVFAGQENRYIFYPSKTATYKLIFNDDNEPMEYKISFCDEKNYIQGPEGNHDWKVLFELKKGMKYEISVVQEQDYGEYYFKMIEDAEEE